MTTRAGTRSRWIRALLVAGMALAAAQPAGAEQPAPCLFGPPERPTVVRAGFYLTDVSAIDEREESLEIEGELSLRWRDPRMAFDPAAAGLARKIYQGGFQFSELSPAGACWTWARRWRTAPTPQTAARNTSTSSS